MEAGVVEREAAIEVKWAETTAARRAVKQVNLTSVSNIIVVELSEYVSLWPCSTVVTAGVGCFALADTYPNC